MPAAPEPAIADRLLTTVTEQLARRSFDGQDAELLQQMVEALADGRGVVRLQLVEAFGEIGMAATPYLLQGLTHHPNPVVRRSCGKALAKIGDGAAVAALVDALVGDGDAVVRSSAAGALARMGAAAVPDLLSVLESDRPAAAKNHAAWALSHMGRAAISELSQAVRSANADVRWGAVSAIANLSLQQEIGPLAQEAEPATEALLEEILRNALGDSAPAVRIEAATGLGNLARLDSLQYLLPLLRDPIANVRKAAVFAVMKLDDPAALAPLQELYVDLDDTVRAVAALAIAQLSCTRE